MKKLLLLTLTSLLTLTPSLLDAQAPRARGGGGGMRSPGPKFDANFRKLFAEHPAWTAQAKIEAPNPRGGGNMIVPTTISMLDASSRMEMDLTKVEGGGLPPGAAEQIKAMGMAEIIMLARPDKKAAFVVYPGMEAYLEAPLPPGSEAGLDNVKMELTEQGKETVNGQACVKSKYVITNAQGEKQEGTVWKATELKGFPVRLETTENGQPMTMNFTSVKFEKAAATQFDPPATFKKFESQQAMMQEIMMKRFGGGAGGPPVPPVPKK